MDVDPTMMTLTEGSLRGWTEQPGESLSGALDSHETLPKLLYELAEAQTARLAGEDYPPVLLGSHELIRVVGAGGMGQVFAARETATEELIALKLLSRSSPRWLRQLKQEFRVLADLRHPNLVALETLTVLPNGVGFFTMELVDGRPFNDYVRRQVEAGAQPRSERLRRVLVQLLEAACYLHDNGYVHRDLKPANVLVTQNERVVVLDFGLVQDATRSTEGEEHIVGTPAYMAPEQAMLQPTGPAVDIYAIGVMMFECLCGRRPFLGSLPTLLQAKHEQDAPAPARFAPEVDPQLSELCQRMLARDPAQRPSAQTLLGALGARATRSPRRPAIEFIGRKRELRELHRALEDVRWRKRPTLMRVHGPSGQGKSALMRAFVDKLEGEVLILWGRCYERESLPYKGFDMAVDALCRHLRKLPADQRPRLPAASLGPLTRLFPVLAEVWETKPGDETPEQESPQTAASEQRALAFEALAKLLAILARSQPLLMIVDDFHWADLDSVQLLDALLAVPQELCALFVLTHRDVRDVSVALRELDARIADANAMRAPVVELPVGPLAPEDGVALALSLLADETHTASGQNRARALVLAAGGNPFYLTQVARGQDIQSDDSDLDRLVARRLVELAPASRRILNFAALAGRPLAGSVLSRLSASSAAIEGLLEQDLLRRDEAGLLTTSHDRIREVAVAELGASALPDLYRQLAEALEGQAGPEQLAEFFAKAGLLPRAAGYAEQAAQQAAASLAYEPAATWLERCLEWLPNDAPRRDAIELQLADAFANAARFADASALLLQLARRDEAHAHGLRGRAATYLLSSGRFEEGMQAVAELVGGIGLHVERRLHVLVPLVLISRLRVNRDLRRFRRARGRPLKPAQQAELDVLQAVISGLAGQEVLQASYWHMRWREKAAEYGAQAPFARALTLEATMTSAMHDGKRWRRVQALAESLAPNDAETQLWFGLQSVFVAVNRHRYDEGLVALDRLKGLLDGPRDVSWERRLVRDLEVWILLWSGKLRQASQLADYVFRIGRESSDPKLQRDGAGLRTAALVRLGELDEAQRSLALTRSARKASPDKRFIIADLWAACAWIELLLRSSRCVEARAACEQLRLDMTPDGLWRVPAYRRVALVLAASTEVQAQLEEPSAPLRRRARRRARKLIAQIDSNSPIFRASAAALEAGQLEIDGHPDQALVAWQRAHEGFERAGCRASLAAVASRWSDLLQGEQALILRAQAQAYFDEQRLCDIDDFLRALVPAPARPAQLDQGPPEP